MTNFLKTFFIFALITLLLILQNNASERVDTYNQGQIGSGVVENKTVK